MKLLNTALRIQSLFSWSDFYPTIWLSSIKANAILLNTQYTRPTVSIITTWSGATPYEIEKEIVQRQEKFLKNLYNLIAITSTSRESYIVIPQMKSKSFHV